MAFGRKSRLEEYRNDDTPGTQPAIVIKIPQSLISLIQLVGCCET